MKGTHIICLSLMLIVMIIFAQAVQVSSKVALRREYSIHDLKRTYLKTSGKSLMNNFTEENLHSYDSKRARMVNSQLKARGITDSNVLKAMNSVPRHLFVPQEFQKHAYVDSALPIGYDQTISQPYIVALICKEAHISPNDKVLDIGTGSGYQAAVLSLLSKEVYSMELIEALGKQAETLLHDLGYNNVHVKIGNGYVGWPEHAPYDAILVAAAAEEVPKTLLDQLNLNGRLIIPIGPLFHQRLMRFTKTKDGFKEQDLGPVTFVPFRKEA